MISRNKILSYIPQQAPFRFVDEIEVVSEDHIVGSYHFREDEYFYQGHFPDNPITPGVILIESMAQIGLVGLGIFLLHQAGISQHVSPVFTQSEVDFLLPVYPNEKVRVRADKVYYRLNKLKCFVVMKNEANEVVCRGNLSGVMIKDPS